MNPREVFTCRMCGDCCRGYGGTVVSGEEMAAIARHIGADPHRFREAFCQRSGRQDVLVQKEDGYCVFWNGKCTIHPVKPRMCRAWPFIPAVLVDTGNWYAMAGSCPGMRTDVTPTQIRAAVTRALAAGGDSTTEAITDASASGPPAGKSSRQGSPPVPGEGSSFPKAR